VPKRVPQFDGGYVTVMVPAAIFDRLEKVAPTIRGQRSAFIREAIATALDRAEQQAERDDERAPAAF
jgi:predicted transcriptional regulator